MNVTHNFELCVKLFLQGGMTACMFIDLKKKYWLHKLNLFFGVIFFLQSFIHLIFYDSFILMERDWIWTENPAKTHYIEVINWSACLSDIGISSSPSNQNSESHRSAVFLCGTQITVFYVVHRLQSIYLLLLQSTLVHRINFFHSSLSTTIGKNKKLSKDVRNKIVDMQQAGMDY